MQNPSFRRAIPNFVTCLGLAGAICAIFMIMEGHILFGGTLVLISAMLDGIDGELARRLNVSSDLGLQLDSLADVVCFGVAPSVLMAQYLSGTNVPSWFVWGSAIAFVLCSALRLARFNASIMDDLLKDFQGLPTTAAGSFLALLIYLDYQKDGMFLPLWAIPFAAIGLAILMVSNIRFMSKKGYKVLTIISLIATVILGIFVSLPLAGLIFLSTHIVHGLLRAAWKWTRNAVRAGKTSSC